MLRPPSLSRNRAAAGLLLNETTGRVVASEAVVAWSWAGRAVGFIARRRPWPSGALGIPGCSCVHTFGVARPLDIAFCNHDGFVLFLIAGLRPNRVSPHIPGAFWVWETEAGGLTETGAVQIGDRLAWEPVGSDGESQKSAER